MKIFNEVYNETKEQIADVYSSAYAALMNYLKKSSIEALTNYVRNIRYIPESAKCLTISIESFELTEEALLIVKVKCTFNGSRKSFTESLLLAKNIPGVLICDNQEGEFDLVYKGSFPHAYIKSTLGNISLNSLFSGKFSVKYPLPQKGKTDT